MPSRVAVSTALPPRRRGAMVVATVVAAVVLGLAGARVVGQDRTARRLASEVLVPSGSVAAALLMVTWHDRRRRGQAERLRDAARRVRLHAGATGELDAAAAACPGPLAAVAEELRLLALEHKRQVAEMRQVKDDCRRAIEQRDSDFRRRLSTAETRARRDALTGLGNRGAFDEALPLAVEAARRDGQPLGLTMIDVDHFKQLNDTLGHPAGDAMLRDVGRLIRSAVREHDGAYRYGGDEFVLILPGANTRQAASTADRLARLVAELARPLKLSPPVALSCGVATLAEGQSAADLLAAADAECYRVKQAARRRRAA